MGRRGPRNFKRHDYVKIRDGLYTTVLHGVKVRVIRGVVGYHPHYHTFSRQPSWKVMVADADEAKKLECPVNMVFADGDISRNGSVDSAEAAIGRRLAKK